MHKRSFTKLSTRAHWSHSQSHTSNGFFKLVEALQQTGAERGQMAPGARNKFGNPHVRT